MADEIDIAQAREQQHREDALRNKKRKPEAPQRGGECLYCNDKLPVTRRWCNAECRDAWELERKRKSLAGDDDTDA